MEDRDYVAMRPQARDVAAAWLVVAALFLGMLLGLMGENTVRQCQELQARSGRAGTPAQTAAVCRWIGFPEQEPLAGWPGRDLANGWLPPQERAPAAVRASSP